MRIKTINNTSSNFEDKDIKWYLFDEQLWITKYQEYYQIEESIDKSIGSFNWLYEVNDTVLFDRKKGSFETAIIDLSEKIKISYSKRISNCSSDWNKGIVFICDKTNQTFEFPQVVFYSEYYDCLYALPEEIKKQQYSIVYIANNFGFVIVENQLKGWILRNASKHIYSGEGIINISKFLLVKYIDAINHLVKEDLTKIHNLISYLDKKNDFTSQALKNKLYELL